MYEHKKSISYLLNEDGKEVTYSAMSQRFRKLQKEISDQLRAEGKEQMAAGRILSIAGQPAMEKLGRHCTYFW